MGGPLLPEDEEHLKSLASNLVSLYAYRESLEGLIKGVAEEAVPNLSVVAGPVLAAKLIEKAGNLKKLAMMPSGTVQLLGAEKALFRSKKTGAKPPKHGLIFQHSYIHAKPRKLRGKAARSLAAKISIAARADAFSGNPIGAELRRQLDEEPERQDTE
jgi:nucleolar protein 56